VVAALLVAASAAQADRDGAQQLRALLREADVPLERGATPRAQSFSAAWQSFERYARLPAGTDGGDLVFETGVYESHYWGTSFEVAFTRRSGAANVHLVVHFPVAAFIAITRDLRAAPCLPGAGCLFACFFVGDDGLVPHPCKVVPRGTGGYRVGDMTLRKSQAGTTSRWIAAVESSPVFRGLLARSVRPDGFELWQESG
jgi:hypothetical protein